ncbi:MAG TPA: glutamate mutase L [Ktedonosporobacter sp.]|nr:glutamate mutase L [Ktedonosporobacter sp.]
MYQQPYPEGGQGPTQRHNTASISSLLVADCGAVFTKVSLFGLVEGQYRLLARGEAPTTATPPQGDITSGVIQAINEIEFITGRRFVEEMRLISPERPDGNGADVFITTVSAGDPLRLMVLGAVSPELESLASQAVSGLYAEAQPLSAPSFLAATAPAPVPVSAGVGMGTPPPAGAWTSERLALEWERQLGLLRELQPHAALIIGMADGPAGPNPLQEACQLLVNAAREHAEQQGGGNPSPEGVERQLSVLYAGAPQYVEAVRRMLEGVADVIRLDPLASQAQLGALSVAVGALHERSVIQRLPGYDRLRAWAGSEPVATATSLSSLVRFLAQHYAMNVTAVDVGGATTTVMLAGEQGEFIPMVNAGIGMGQNIGAILQQLGLQRIARWLPFSVTEEEVRQFVLNRMLHPQALPTTPRELQISQAFAREAISLTVEAAQKHYAEWPDTDLILATGGVLSHAPKYGQVAMMLLDALQPRGVTSLVLDRTMLISQLGAVATVAPITAVQVNENDAVTHRLGTCVIPFGNLQPGQVAVRVGVEYTNGREFKVDVMAGTIEVIPLRINEQALLTLFPAPGVDVGLGPGERARAAEEIDGGLIGLIIDARGRPLQLPLDETERHARLLQWAQALGAL